MNAVETTKFKANFSFDANLLSLEGSIYFEDRAKEVDFVQLVQNTIAQSPACLTLDLSKLSVLDSTARHWVYEMLVAFQHIDDFKLVVKGSPSSLCQDRLMHNAKTLIAATQLEFVA